MEKDLNDIDLIDKYLSGNLNEVEQREFKERFLTDEEFKKEVEVYQKIYEGIEQAGRENLKKQLNFYYDEYAAEDEESDNVRSINWRRNIYVISAIAAASAAFFVVFKLTSPVTNNGTTGTGSSPVAVRPVKPTPPKVGPQDTDVKVPQPQVAQHPKPHPSRPLPKDTSGRQMLPNITPPGGGYALNDQTRLPATAIRRAGYPQALSYTFSQGQLTVFGNPLLRMLDISVYKKGGHYYLDCDDSVYEIVNTATEKPLVKLDKQITGDGIKSAEKIKVVLAPLKAAVYANAPFAVVVEKAAGAPRYYFTKSAGVNTLVLLGNFVPGNTTVVSLKNDSGTNWYVRSGTHIYSVDGQPASPLAFKELQTLTNDNARMLIGREGIERTVLTF